MSPPSWATPEQTAFLLSHKAGYLSSRNHGRQAFLSNVDHMFFERWSERERLFGPPVPDSPRIVSDAEAQTLKEAIARRKQVINLNIMV
jgi:hypothetical protein